MLLLVFLVFLLDGFVISFLGEVAPQLFVDPLGDVVGLLAEALQTLLGLHLFIHAE
jgi:hypothetical protein